jgi:hypothetical protein
MALRLLFATKPPCRVGSWLNGSGRGPQEEIAKIANIAGNAKILKAQNPAE